MNFLWAPILFLLVIIGSSAAAKPPKDQSDSPTCSIYALTAYFEKIIEKKEKKEIDISEGYTILSFLLSQIETIGFDLRKAIRRDDFTFDGLDISKRKSFMCWFKNKIDVSSNIVIFDSFANLPISEDSTLGITLNHGVVNKSFLDFELSLCYRWMEFIEEIAGISYRWFTDIRAGKTSNSLLADKNLIQLIKPKLSGQWIRENANLADLSEIIDMRKPKNLFDTENFSESNRAYRYKLPEYVTEKVRNNKNLFFDFDFQSYSEDEIKLAIEDFINLAAEQMMRGEMVLIGMPIFDSYGFLHGERIFYKHNNSANVVENHALLLDSFMTTKQDFPAPIMLKHLPHDYDYFNNIQAFTALNSWGTPPKRDRSWSKDQRAIWSRISDKSKGKRDLIFIEYFSQMLENNSQEALFRGGLSAIFTNPAPGERRYYFDKLKSKRDYRCGVLRMPSNKGAPFPKWLVDHCS